MLVKITRYVCLLGCGMLAGIAATVLVLELALRGLNGQEYVRVRQAEFAFFTPFIGAVLVLTLVPWRCWSSMRASCMTPHCGQR